MRPEEFQARFDVSRETMARLAVYHNLLIKWQKAVNLVSPKTLEDAWVRHFADSAQLAEFIPPGAATLLDMGSGAGFPGLVLAITRPALSVHLVESDSRKCEFLKNVSRETLTKLIIHNSRIEGIQVLQEARPEGWRRGHQESRSESRQEGHQEGRQEGGNVASGTRRKGRKNGGAQAGADGRASACGDGRGSGVGGIRDDGTIRSGGGEDGAARRGNGEGGHIKDEGKGRPAENTGLRTAGAARVTGPAAGTIPVPDVITARALAPLDKLLDYCLPFAAANPGLKMIFPKGKGAEAEIAAAQARYEFSLETLPSATDRQGRILAITKLKIMDIISE